MTDKFIIEGFWQGKDNCICIAIIKAAIIKYGFNRVFKIERKGSHFLITLKNNLLLTITDTEIKKLNRNSEIIFRRPRDEKKKLILRRLKRYVRLCFAVIVRNIQLNGYEGKEYTQTDAVQKLLLKGIKTDHIHTLLGLHRKTVHAHKLAHKHLLSFKRKKATLLYSDNHIVVASGGYYDNYGEAKKLGTRMPSLRGRKAKFWYELK